VTTSQHIVPGQPVSHPGPAAEDRITAVSGITVPIAASDLLGEILPSGSLAPKDEDFADRSTRPLGDLMVEVVEAAGADSGIVEFSALAMPRISYCIPAPGDAAHPMSYSDTRESSGLMLHGTATGGFRQDPADATRLTRWVHMHAAWTDADGTLRGGHLWPASRTADPLAHATVWPLYGITLVNSHDEETRMPVFAPLPGTVSSAGRAQLRARSGARPAVFARVRPNVDIAQAVADLGREHGLTGGSVRGGCGSLTGALFDDGRIVEGPATEIIALSGCLIPGTAALSASVISASGRVHGGRLAARGNLVSVTYDLMLTGPPPADGLRESFSS
jgi:predicted DNA-binding protein with PD1-like motif